MLNAPNHYVGGDLRLKYIRFSFTLHSLRLAVDLGWVKRGLWIGWLSVDSSIDVDIFEPGVSFNRLDARVRSYYHRNVRHPSISINATQPRPHPSSPLSSSQPSHKSPHVHGYYSSPSPHPTSPPSDKAK